MPKSIDLAVQIINYIFSVIFILEAIIKIVALGFEYFKDSWNIFDFLIVIATIISTILELATNMNGARATVVRAFRVARVFRIIKRAKVLKIIVDTFIVSLPSLLNVGGLLLIILFIYAVLGV